MKYFRKCAAATIVLGLAVGVTGLANADTIMLSGTVRDFNDRHTSTPSYPIFLWKPSLHSSQKLRAYVSLCLNKCLTQKQNSKQLEEPDAWHVSLGQLEAVSGIPITGVQVKVGHPQPRGNH